MHLYSCSCSVHEVGRVPTPSVLVCFAAAYTHCEVSRRYSLCLHLLWSARCFNRPKLYIVFFYQGTFLGEISVGIELGVQNGDKFITLYFSVYFSACN
jgi:hypothetical protein